MPYAKALFDVVTAEDPKAVETVIEQLDRVAEAVDTVPDFLKVLVTPMVTPEVKTKILDTILDQLEVREPTRKFVHVVQRHYRMLYMGAIRDTYRELVDRSKGRVRASIEVSHSPSAEERKKLTDAVASVVDSTVIAEFRENPDLLAGFRVQVGSKVFDGSLVGQLEQLRRQTQFE
jgi:F-type H+-transporting ATPase subunit delta